MKRSNKFFFIRSNKTKFGGAEVYLSRLSDALNKKNIQHEVVNSIFPKFLPSWLRAILFNLQVCLNKRNKFYFSLDRITCPDIYRAGDGVHKVFLTIEDKSKINPLHPIYLFLEKRCFNNAKKIIAISNMVKKDIVGSYKVDEKKISVVYNGIPLKDYNYNSSFDRISSEFYLKPNQHILLYVGSGFKRKGVEEFLQIISRLESDNILAFVIGKDKNIDHYRQLSLKLNINNKVIFTGPRLDVDDFYTISDVFIFPTRYEPFGNVILEAMNFRNAVFTTKQCGGGEILSEYFIMNQADDYSVVSKINDLLGNKLKLEAVKKDNRTLSKQFSIDRNLKETLNVIESLENSNHLE
jgi:UDP-glucose:(heptosyl)LPS alpha-1,3-glucosyltransferase